MTIVNKPSLPGAAAFARTGYRLDPQLATHTPVSWAESGIKGNLAVGRTGQVMVVDRVDVLATAQSPTAPGFIALRCTNYGDTAGDDLMFPTFSSANSQALSYRVDRLGYVSQPTYSQPSVVAGSSNIKEENHYLCAYASVAATGLLSELFVPGLRYLEASAAISNGVRPGSWGAATVYLLGVTGGLNVYMPHATLCSAPGTGKHLILRSLVMKAVGGATHYRVGLGSNSVGTVTIDAGSSTTVVNVTTPTLVASAHVGSMLVLLTNQYRGEVRQITANTTTTITVGTAFTGAPVSTGAAMIVKPLFEWYSGMDFNEQAINPVLTDLAVPLPENKALVYYAECTGDPTGAFVPAACNFDSQLVVTAGCEVANVGAHNYVNLTGDPQ